MNCAKYIQGLCSIDLSSPSIYSIFSSSIPPTTTNPQSFNDLIRQSSGLTKLKADRFIIVDSTKQDIEQRMEKLTKSIKEPIPKMGDLVNDRQMFVDCISFG